MQTHAIAKNIRVSPYKVRLVVDQIKKMPPADAVKMLDFTLKSAAKPVKKVIMSAIANARNNSNLDGNTLRFKEIQVGHGLAFKRYRPISRGRAHSIKKRTSNIRVVLEGSKTKESTSNKPNKTYKTNSTNKQGG